MNAPPGTTEEIFRVARSLATKNSNKILVDCIAFLVQLRNNVITEVATVYLPDKRYVDGILRVFQLFDTAVFASKLLSFGLQIEPGHDEVYGTFKSLYTLEVNDLKMVLERVEGVLLSASRLADDLYTLMIINAVNVDVGGILSKRRSGGAPAGADGSRLLGLDVNALRRSLEVLSSIRVETVDGAEIARDEDGNNLPPGVVPVPKFNSAYADFMAEVARAPDVPPHLRDLADSIDVLAGCVDGSAALCDRLRERGRRFVLLYSCPGDAEHSRFVAKCFVAGIERRITDRLRVYKVEYGRMLSKYRGESERNFQNIMDWFARRAAANGGSAAGRDSGIDVLWFDGVESLMGSRDANDSDHAASIKNAMLQSLDSFNKNKSLSGFGFIFTTGARADVLDAAFLRRLSTVIVSPGLGDASMRPVLETAASVLSRAAELDGTVRHGTVKTQIALERAVTEAKIARRLVSV